ncbi:MAG: hypothetical protein R3C03_06485 [Pirellulaceae bacterium]
MRFLKKHPAVNWSSRLQHDARQKSAPARSGWDVVANSIEWGVIRKCPAPLDELTHPFDIGISDYFVPGNRLLNRTICQSDDRYSLCAYGNLEFRILPVIWQAVRWEGISLGDLVEVTADRLSRFDKTLAIVEEIFFIDGRLNYQLREQQILLPRFYSAQEIRKVRKLDEMVSFSFS